MNRLLAWVDNLQANTRPLAYVVGVAKKYGDDNASQFAALMTYYSFLSVFPLLLAVGVVLSVILDGDPALQEDIFNELIGDRQVRADIEGAISQVSSAAWWVLLISFGAFLFSALGGVSAAYTALNATWGVPVRDRLAFAPRYLRMLGVLAVSVVGVLSVVVLNVRVLPQGSSGLSRFISIFVSVGVVIFVFWLSTKLLLRVQPSGVGLAIASIVGGFAVAAFALSFSLVIGLLISRAGPVYGGLASVVGVLAFFFLTMQAVVIASEAGSVWAWRLWPRGLDLNVARPGDLRAYEFYAQTGLRAPGEQISVNWQGPTTS